MDSEQDDTSSNPNADLHLPASGEFNSDSVKTDDPLTNAEADEEMAPGANNAGTDNAADGDNTGSST